MKKSGILMIIISIIFLIFVNEYYRYDGYKDVEIPEIGIAKVPESWYCSKTKDGLLYFAYRKSRVQSLLYSTFHSRLCTRYK